MKLYICENEGKLLPDIRYITIKTFKNITVHPYISTTNWEVIIVDLDNNVSRSYLFQLIKRGTKIVPIIKGTILSRNQLLLLCDICPDEQQEIIECSKLKDDGKSMKELLKRMNNKYNWDLETKELRL